MSLFLVHYGRLGYLLDQTMTIPQFWIRQKMCQIASSSYLAWPLTWISADKNGLSGVNGGGAEFMSMKYSPNRLTCSVM